MLSKNINTTFRGRSTEIRVYPLSFAEYKSHKRTLNAWDDRKMLNEYLMDGGLLYVVQLYSIEEKYRYVNDICELTLFRDIIDRYDIRNENLLKAVVDLLCSQIGSYVSVNKIVLYCFFDLCALGMVQ